MATPPTERYLPGVIAFGVLAGITTALALIGVTFAAVRGSWITLGLAVLCAGGTILLAGEAWTLTGAAPPITWRERWAHLRHPYSWPLWTLLTGLGIGLLSAHFWWSSCPPLPPLP